MMNGESIFVKSCESVGDAYMYSIMLLMFEGMNVVCYEIFVCKVKILMYGCDCYVYGLFVMGFVDFVVEVDFKLYDYMAFVFIVKGAGGYMIDWKGNVLCFIVDCVFLEFGEF